MTARYLGVMSGTSVDGVDLALIEPGPPFTIIAGTTAAFSPDERNALVRLALGQADDIDSLGRADAMLGRRIGEMVLGFLARSGVAPKDIAAIGSHGQTVRHRPEGEDAFTLQIGDPNRIAEVTGITTVADLRRRDIAAGGQGAPLVPPFHRVLFGDETEDRLVMNIGGIGNVTYLPANPRAPVTGYDTGPGNGLMDAWVEKHRQREFDRDGSWADSGASNDDLLTTFLADDYFATPPPKSTGKEYFNLGWIESRIRKALDPADVQATLAELTARTLAEPAQGIRRVFVCGGGRLNRHLMQRLRAALPSSTVEPSDGVGVNGDWIEAAAFAWLAQRRLEGKPGNVPEVTGAAGPRVLGAIYPGR